MAWDPVWEDIFRAHSRLSELGGRHDVRYLLVYGSGK